MTTSCSVTHRGSAWIRTRRPPRMEDASPPSNDEEGRAGATARADAWPADLSGPAEASQEGSAAVRCRQVGLWPGRTQPRS